MIDKILLTINLYLVKTFLKRFFYVLISIALLIFVINLFEVLNNVKGAEDIAFYQILNMALLQVPPFISEIAIFIIMLTSMITLFGLSTKSEITVMRSTGMSLWRILLPIIILVFVIGIIFVFLFLPLSIMSQKQYNIMETELIQKEQRDSFAPRNGIWLKHDNLEQEGEEIKIRASRIYKSNLRMRDVTIWFFDKNNQFYQKLDIKNMYLKDNNWHLKEIIVNDDENINKELEELFIPTNLEADFIIQKIVNNFEDVKLFSIIALPELINNLESAGFSSRKFRVYFHYLLNQPLLFVCMVLIAAYFSINNIRNRNNMLYIILGIIFGLITYISLNIINAFGASGLIPAFMSTWLVTFLFLALAILLLFRKENLG